MKKKLLALLLSTALVGTMLAGCGNTQPEQEPDAEQAAQEQVVEEQEAPAEEAPPAASSEKKVVAIHQPAMAPYCTAIVEGATETLEAAGYEVNVKYGDLTSDGQLKDIEDFVTLGVSALIVFPWDSSAIKASLETCKAAGIPIFVVDNPIEDTDLVVSQVATDNYRAGAANAEQLIKDLDGKGKIVVLDTPENNSSLLRANGFCETLKEKAPDIEIVAQQNYNADQAKAMNIMEDVLQTDADINAVFACNEDGAFGAVAALEAKALTDVKVYTVDGSANGVSMVKEGKITGIAAQQPFLMGQTAAEQVVSYFESGETEADIPLDIMYVTGENADSWEGF